MDKTLLAAGLACLFAAPVFGQAPTSAYTRTDGEGACTGLEEELDEGYYFYSVCQGYGGWVLHLDGGEHGQRSTFRPDADPIPDEQRPSAFNYPFSQGNFGYFHNVIEWRLASAENAPYAVIHRYYAQVPDPDGMEWSTISTLTVSALRTPEAGGTCMVAHIAATTLADANLVARDVADRYAPGFTCGQDRAVIIDTVSPTLDAAIAAGSFTP